MKSGVLATLRLLFARKALAKAMFSTAVRRSAAGWAQAPLAQSPTVTQMAMFVHLTTESRIPRIRRTGIARLRKPVGTSPAGVYAVPVTRNFYASHQWLRELKRRNQGAIAGIYFRVPDEQLVWVGHYGKAHRFVTSAQAIAEFTKADNPLGWEVVVPRRIEANEIHKTRRLPQVIGWRFSPKAKGKPPFCTCKFCTHGDYGSATLRRRLGSPDDK